MKEQFSVSSNDEPIALFEIQTHLKAGEGEDTWDPEAFCQMIQESFSQLFPPLPTQQ